MRSLSRSPNILSGDRGGDHLGVMGKALSLPLQPAALQTVETNKMVIKSTFLSACPILLSLRKSSALLWREIAHPYFELLQCFGLRPRCI